MQGKQSEVFGVGTPVTQPADTGTVHKIQARVIYPHAWTELKRVGYQDPGSDSRFAFSVNRMFGGLPIEIADKAGKVIVKAEAVETVLQRIGKIYPPDWCEPNDALVRMELESRAKGLYTVSGWDVENEKSRRHDEIARQTGYTGLLLQVFEHRESELVHYNPCGLPGCHLVAAGDTGTVATALLVIEYGHCVHTVCEDSSTGECKHVVFAYETNMVQSLSGLVSTRSAQVVDNSLTEYGMGESTAGRAIGKYLELCAAAARS